MRKNWIKQKLGEVFSLEYGKPLPKDRRDDKGKFPAYGANGVKCRTNDVYWNKASIVVGRKGSTGELRLVEPGFWPLDVTYYITYDKNKHDLKFLYYMLSRLKLPTLAKGVKPGINRNDVYTIEQFIPPLPEQKRIVTILDEAFAGIEKAVANTEKNLANARELFESYLNSVFSQRGEGWEEKHFSEICSITSKLIDPRLQKFIDLPHIGAGNIVSMTGELINIQTARSEGLKSGKFAFGEEAVLYSKIRPNLMKVARPGFEGICSADIYPLTTVSGVLNRDFLYYMLLSRAFTEYAIAGSARAGIPKVNRDYLFKYKAVLPNITEQKQLVESLDYVSWESQHLESIYKQKLTVLAELKQSLLQKAFSGELTAERIENDVQEAVA